MDSPLAIRGQELLPPPVVSTEDSSSHLALQRFDKNRLLEQMHGCDSKSTMVVMWEFICPEFLYPELRIPYYDSNLARVR